MSDDRYRYDPTGYPMWQGVPRYSQEEPSEEDLGGGGYGMGPMGSHNFPRFSETDYLGALSNLASQGQAEPEEEEENEEEEGGFGYGGYGHSGAHGSGHLTQTAEAIARLMEGGGGAEEPQEEQDEEDEEPSMSGGGTGPYVRLQTGTIENIARLLGDGEAEPEEEAEEEGMGDMGYGASFHQHHRGGW